MELYEKNNNSVTRWASPENLLGEKGKGGMRNNQAKGHAWERIEAGESVTLLNVQGSGIVQRIWITINDRSPEMLRSLVIEMYWDNSSKPAVSVPLGDFFCAGLGVVSAFENELFSSPEGRSFNTYIPMPFTENAKIIVKNEASKLLSHIYYDVNYILKPIKKEDIYYFHAYWHRQNPTVLCEDFAILPQVFGEGRFLGSNIGVLVSDKYLNTWWGEGEVKIYLDDDEDYPTLVGTGTEDYIGSGWEQGTYGNRYQGCLIADKQRGRFSFYRLHIKDTVFFNTGCKVTIQQMGGADRDTMIKIMKAGIGKFKLAYADFDAEHKEFMNLYESNPDTMPDDPSIDPNSGMAFFRQDDVCAAAYFYLNSPASNLPEIQACNERIINR